MGIILQQVKSRGPDDEGTYLRFSGVRPQVFENFYNNLELDDRNSRATYLGADSGILLVKMPSDVHEMAKGTAIGYMLGQATHMDLLDEIVPIGSARYDSITDTGAAKEPDDGFSPTLHRFKGGDFPTFVIEVAYSQSLQCAREAKD